MNLKKWESSLFIYDQGKKKSYWKTEYCVFAIYKLNIDTTPSKQKTKKSLFLENIKAQSTKTWIEIVSQCHPVTANAHRTKQLNVKTTHGIFRKPICDVSFKQEKEVMRSVEKPVVHHRIRVVGRYILGISLQCKAKLFSPGVAVLNTWVETTLVGWMTFSQGLFLCIRYLHYSSQQ